ncbi:MAG: hypothetical protein HOP33_23070 [Verrucomicrobia bacterium]|nr:hypothetical protein [Verrucomicrobiota bacterium]
MKTKKLRLLVWVAGVVALAWILYAAGMLVAEKIYGGPHVVLAGESHSFSIGMTKKEVLKKYRDLNETVNLRTIETNRTGGSPVILERSELLLTRELELSDHWMAYRDKFPIWFQDFYFSDGKLTNITTYIRFYESP